MAGQLYLAPKQAPLSDGEVQPFSKRFYYLSGTTTPADTFTTPDLTVANSNPQIADSAGVFDPAYLDPENGRYRVKWTDADDVQLSQDDDVLSGSSASQDYTVQSSAPFIDLIETDATTDNGAWRIKAESEQLVIYAMNDAKSIVTPILAVDRSGTTVDVLNFTATTVQVGGQPIIASGSFTGAVTGFASSLTPTIQWRRSGNFVTLTCNAGSTGTSTTNAMTLTGMPSSIRPTVAQNWLTRLTDNTVVGHGIASVGTNGTVTFGNGITGGTFTASGTKGLPGGWTLNYELQL